MKGAIIIQILILSALCGCKESEVSSNNFSLIKAGDLMPAFEVKVAGSSDIFNSQNTDGKRVLIYIFASACPDCHRQTPAVIDLWSRVQQDNDLIFMCIARGGSEIFTSEQHALDYWLELKTQGGNQQMPPLYYDANRVVFSKFASQNVPRFYVINNTGTICWEGEGQVSVDFLESKLSEAK